MLTEFEIEACAVLNANLVKCDDSFDHEFGREIRIGWDLHNIQIFVFIEGQQIEVTEKFTQLQIEKLKKQALKQITDEAV